MDQRRLAVVTLRDSPLERGVPVVLDGVGGSSLQHLGDVGPLVTDVLVCRDDDQVLVG